ncbi:MAG TPA: hypothetical protein VNM48_19340, partial [Chloroflexota bacterium]|nr:hypothetical protein [Chloroflexota bacterium]
MTVKEVIVDIRTCRCGCGTPLKSARAEFVQGHNVRVAPRTGNRGAAAPVLERPLCACGCGQRVKTLGGRYLRGHQPRPMAPGAEIRTCICGKSERVPPSRVNKWRACSEPCLHARNLTSYAKNRLLQRILDRMLADHLTLKAFGEAAGVKASVLNAWFHKEGRRP